MRFKHKTKALFVAANPLMTAGRKLQWLDLEAELRDILEKIESSEHRDVLEMLHVPAARVDDLEKSLLKHEPVIVHFSGHGGAQRGVLMRGEDSYDDAEGLDPESMRRLFVTLKKNVRLVVLNFCNSLETAREMAGHIDFVVGMSGPIDDTAARLFSASFYRAIGFGESIQTAFELGLGAVKRFDKETCTPVLLTRAQASPATVLIKGPATNDYWNVPNRNEYFTGREEQLETLNDLLKKSKTVSLTQTITGLGGIGKTQIAIEFCHSNKDVYPSGVFWADASSAATLRAAYAAFAVELDWIPKDAPVDEAAQIWLRRASRTPGWLLVLDNADDPQDIDELIPKRASGHILITTRSQDPGWGGDPMAVDVLPPNDAVELLLSRSRRKEAERVSCEQLADALGYLPLALEQAAAYLAQNRMIRVQDYLEGFNSRQIAFTEAEKSSRPLKGDYEKTVATTWAISFEKLTDAAREAMQAFAFLAPDDIPLQLFEQGGHLGPALALLDLSDGFVVQREIIKPLTAYSFVQVGDSGETVSVHRLIQAVMLDRLESEKLLDEKFKSTHTALSELNSTDPTDPASWSTFARWFPHLRKAMTFWLSIEHPFDTWLWNLAAHYAWNAGRSLEARGIFQAQLEVHRRELGDEHPDTLLSINNLAETFHALGDAQAARDLHQQALDVNRRVLGNEHPDTLRSINNLALTVRALGDVQAARDLHQQAFEVSRRVLGDEHPSTLASINNLASILRALGDAEAARDLQQHALDVTRYVLGDEHPGTLVSINNLAETFHALGDAEAARNLHQEVLDVSRRVLGDEHPETLASINNLAETLRALGDAEAAQALHQEALDVNRRMLGDEHPDTFVSINNLASTLHALGDVEAARALHQQALDVSRRIFGNEHPSTLSSINNLAEAFLALGDTQNARDLHQQALDVSRRVLGAEHPSTLISIHNLLHAMKPCISAGDDDGTKSFVELAIELLSGVQKLPERTPIRVAAEQAWGELFQMIKSE